MMDFDLETDDALTGMAAWFEKDATTGVFTLYALHLTGGVPDAAPGGGFAIQPLVVGSTTYTSDLLNMYSATNAFAERAVRMVAVSPNGNAAVVWRVYNGLSAEPAKGQLFTRRYLNGAWGPTELVEASTGVAWQYYDLAIDDAGDMIAASIGGSDYRFLHGRAGAAWAPSQVLVPVSGYSSLPYVALEPTTGVGLVTYLDPTTLRGALTGAFYDPVAQALSPTFTIDDPTQSASLSGAPRSTPAARPRSPSSRCPRCCRPAPTRPAAPSSTSSPASEGPGRSGQRQRRVAALLADAVAVGDVRVPVVVLCPV